MIFLCYFLVENIVKNLANLDRNLSSFFLVLNKKKVVFFPLEMMLVTCSTYKLKQKLGFWRFQGTIKELSPRLFFKTLGCKLITFYYHFSLGSLEVFFLFSE